MANQYTLGIDTGGTFTDVTVLTEEGEIWIAKAPTTPHDLSLGVMDALEAAAQTLGIRRAELLQGCHFLKHGTTVAINALIQRTGCRVGLITTRGFEDTPLVMRAIGRVAGLGEEEIKHQAMATKPEPLVPRELIRGVTERIDFTGRVVIPLNLEEAEEALRSLIQDYQVEAIAVNLLFGFVNPLHEEKIREMADSKFGDRGISFSFASRLVPVVREYARTNTVILNAFLDKTMRGYIQGLERRLQEEGYARSLLIMQSNGGIVHSREMTARPATAAGGPSPRSPMRTCSWVTWTPTAFWEGRCR